MRRLTIDDLRFTIYDLVSNFPESILIFGQENYEPQIAQIYRIKKIKICVICVICGFIFCLVPALAG
jgi:hypothetical protein